MSQIKHGREQRDRIVKFLLGRQGLPATTREIGRAMGMASSSTVHNHMRKLVDEGRARRPAMGPGWVATGEPAFDSLSELSDNLQSLRDWLSHWENKFPIEMAEEWASIKGALERMDKNVLS